MTLELLEAAVRNKVKRFVFSSSAAVYGDTCGRPAKEDMLPQPLSHYAVQKLACEHYCKVYGQLYGLETVCLRYFNVYGPRQRPDSPYSGVISRFVDAAHDGSPITIFGDGMQTRDFVNVADVARTNVAAAIADEHKVAGRIFNVGTGASISVNDLAHAVVQEFGTSTQITHAAGRPGEIRNSQASIGEMAALLGLSPSVPFRQGLHQLCASA